MVTEVAQKKHNGLEAGPIPGTEGAVNPFFSPDGQWLGFFADQELKKVSVSGGVALILGNAVYSFGASWASQGMIAFARTTSGAAVVDSWKCRECAQLRYASEGGALLHRPRTALGKMLAAIDNFTRHDRPEPLYPDVFANPADMT